MYIPSEKIKNLIREWEGSSMKTNRSFELEAADFERVLRQAGIFNLMSLEELDPLFSLSYNIGSGNFKLRVVPSLINLYKGNGTVDAVTKNMYGKRDSEPKMSGLRTRRAKERLLFSSAYTSRHNTSQPITSQVNYTETQNNYVEIPEGTYELKVKLLISAPKIEPLNTWNPFLTLPWYDPYSVNNYKTGGRLIKKYQDSGKFESDNTRVVKLYPLYYSASSKWAQERQQKIELEKLLEQIRRQEQAQKLARTARQYAIAREGLKRKRENEVRNGSHPELNERHARMDNTTVALNTPRPTLPDGNEKPYTPTSTYTQTPYQESLKTPKSNANALSTVAGLAPFVVPAAVAAGPSLVSGAVSTLTNPAFWIEAGKDIATYLGLDIGSQLLTGKGLGAHTNNLLGLEDEHPAGEFLSFGLTSPAKWAGKKLLYAISPEYALKLELKKAMSTPSVYRTMENGKVRLSLPSHSDATPRQLVIEPLGGNKYYVHVRTWGGVTLKEIQLLQDALYEELPEGAEILFPLSSENYLGTRGTVAALLRMSRDPRYVPGKPGTLLYTDKDGTVKTFTGTGYIKPAMTFHLSNAPISISEDNIFDSMKPDIKLAKRRSALRMRLGVFSDEPITIYSTKQGQEVLEKLKNEGMDLHKDPDFKDIILLGHTTVNSPESLIIRNLLDYKIFNLYEPVDPFSKVPRLNGTGADFTIPERGYIRLNDDGSVRYWSTTRASEYVKNLTNQPSFFAYTPVYDKVSPGATALRWTLGGNKSLTLLTKGVEKFLRPLETANTHESLGHPMNFMLPLIKDKSTGETYGDLLKKILDPLGTGASSTSTPTLQSILKRNISRNMSERELQALFTELLPSLIRSAAEKYEMPIVDLVKLSETDPKKVLDMIEECVTELTDELLEELIKSAQSSYSKYLTTLLPTENGLAYSLENGTEIKDPSILMSRLELELNGLSYTMEQAKALRDNVKKALIRGFSFITPAATAATLAERQNNGQ